MKREEEKEKENEGTGKERDGTETRKHRVHSTKSFLVTLLLDTHISSDGRCVRASSSWSLLLQLGDVAVTDVIHGASFIAALSASCRGHAVVYDRPGPAQPGLRSSLCRRRRRRRNLPGTMSYRRASHSVVFHSANKFQDYSRCLVAVDV